MKNYSKDCPNHDTMKRCKHPGCRNLGLHNQRCKFCGSKRRKASCAKHLGKDKNLYKKYVRYRKSACEHCSTTEQLTVHHIDENRANNDPSNLLTLCRECHDIEHGIKRSKPILL